MCTYTLNDSHMYVYVTYIYIYIYICVYVQVVYIYTHAGTHGFIYICIDEVWRVCICTHVCIYACSCLSLCLFASTNLRMHACVYVCLRLYFLFTLASVSFCTTRTLLSRWLGCMWKGAVLWAPAVGCSIYLSRWL